MQITVSTRLNQPLNTVKDGFGEALLAQLTPPGIRLSMIRFDGIYAGARMHFRISQLLGTWNWEGVIEQKKENDRMLVFTDKGLQLPPGLKSWHHTHAILRQNDSTVIIDRVRFSGKNIFFTMFWWMAVSVMLGVRPPRYRKYFKDT